jgi:N-methylhydantoinase A
MPTPLFHRAVWFDGHGMAETPVYRRDDLPAGAGLEGPAIVEQLDSTTVIPPGVAAKVDRFLNIVMRVGG